MQSAGMTVKVARFTQSRLVPVQLEGEHPTVGDALTAAEMEPEGDETIMVNSREADRDTPLNEGDTITLANKPAGG